MGMGLGGPLHSPLPPSLGLRGRTLSQLPIYPKIGHQHINRGGIRGSGKASARRSPWCRTLTPTGDNRRGKRTVKSPHITWWF